MRMNHALQILQFKIHISGNQIRFPIAKLPVLEIIDGVERKKTLIKSSFYYKAPTLEYVQFPPKYVHRGCRPA